MIITIVVCLTLNVTQCHAVPLFVPRKAADPLRECLYAGPPPALDDGQAFIAGVRCDDGAHDMIVGWSPSGLSVFGVVSP